MNLGGVQIGPDEGALIVKCDAQGHVTAHVLQLGLLTEGRLENALMPIFNELVRARVRAYNEVQRVQREII